MEPPPVPLILQKFLWTYGPAGWVPRYEFGEWVAMRFWLENFSTLTVRQTARVIGGKIDIVTTKTPNTRYP